ncbi:hypothetical protein DMUE_2101 [Dictyocoela muelleri]|nr:hypothetical protein DMUE_2101 [Dictyocoela muelleri]
MKLSNKIKNSADKLFIDSFQQLKNKIDDSSAFKEELIKLHCHLQHPGRKSLCNLIKKQISEKKLFLLISELSKNCIKCRGNKYNKYDIQKYLDFYILKRKMRLFIDISGLFVYYKDDFKRKFYVCTFTDICPRYTKIAIIKNINSLSVVNAYKN